MKPTDDPPDSPSNSTSKPPANPSMNPPMTPPMTPIDRDIADAFAALDRTAPEQGQEEFTSRVMARIGDGQSAAAAPRVAVGRESPPTPRGEDSGLHDIVALASRAKQRLSERDQSESDAGESVMLAAAPGGLRAVALPDPSRAARPSASPPPREPTRTDSRSSLPFWALGSVATLAAAAAVAVFVFGIGRGADRSVDAPASSASAPTGSAASAPAGGLARLDEPARDRAALAAQDAPARYAEAPPSPAAPAEAEEPVAASEDRSRRESARRVRRERAEGAETAKATETADEGVQGGVEGGVGGKGVAAPAGGAAPGGVAGGAGGEPDDKPGDANLEDMLDAVTDEEKPKAAPPPEAKPEPPAAEKKELDRRAVSAALESIRGDVDGCHEVEKFAGSVTIKFVVAPSGQVSKAAAIGSHIRTKTGTCVARAVLKASFPAFEGTPITITYPFLLSR